MVAPKKYPDELRERATRLATEGGGTRHQPWRDQADRRPVGCAPGGRATGCQAEIDDGHRPGVRTEEAARIAELERENRELRRANEIRRFSAEIHIEHRGLRACLMWMK
ncbi:hypothetical protein [Rhodococcus sp. JVH1]|uniref:hypothetical protein n=1 Tax=Rhodococcus sp. JVH1 TaxID=745408 RepID=UPI000271DBDD|nr:hypothetical protein [Rhodococcus sp. JVH1]EJI95690.1 transposase IS3/IS911 family protein [Rhodococcus sp. JVH1]